MSGERQRPAGEKRVRSPQELAALLGSMASQTADPKPRRVTHRAPGPALEHAQMLGGVTQPAPPRSAIRPDLAAPDAPVAIVTAPDPPDPPAAAATLTAPPVAPPPARAKARPSADAGGRQPTPPPARSSARPAAAPKSSLIAGRLVSVDTEPARREAQPVKLGRAQRAKSRRPTAPTARLTSRASGRVSAYRRSRRSAERRDLARAATRPRPPARPAHSKRVRLAVVAVAGAIVMILLLALLGAIAGGSKPTASPASHGSPALARPAAPGSTNPTSAIPPPPATSSLPRNQAHH